MLNSRQKTILEIIEENVVSDQNVLLRLLGERGISATQATVSRDIKKLKLKKVRTKNADGVSFSRYVFLPEAFDNGSRNNFAVMYKNALVSIDTAQNIIVVKTHAGMAQAVCAAFDNAGFDRVVGSLAGDDTVFIVCKTTEDAISVMDALGEIAK